MFGDTTLLFVAADDDDLDVIKILLDGFSSDKKYAVLKLQNGYGQMPLHIAAYYGYSSIITYLMTDLSHQQKYDILKIQNKFKNTALHEAACENQLKAVQVILSSVPSELQIQLLNIKNKERKTAADVRPEIAIGYSMLLSQGDVALLIFQKNSGTLLIKRRVGSLIVIAFHQRSLIS